MLINNYFKEKYLAFLKSEKSRVIIEHQINLRLYVLNLIIGSIRVLIDLI